MFDISKLSSKEKYLLESLKNYLINEFLYRLDEFSFDGNYFYPPEDIILCLTEQEHCMLKKVVRNEKTNKR